MAMLLHRGQAFGDFVIGLLRERASSSVGLGRAHRRQAKTKKNKKQTCTTMLALLP